MTIGNSFLNSLAIVPQHVSQIVLGFFSKEANQELVLKTASLVMFHVSFVAFVQFFDAY